MSEWSAGYVADIGYTYGYYEELNPLRARFALLNQGLVCPEFESACELGFGQGVSVNLHAAASSTEWCGTDFNPSQAGFARELAAASGCMARLFDDAFAEFAARSDLPDFDFIGLHGIWSWISDTNRSLIVDFVRRRLKVGGVLYVSYNALPGWSAFAPMRHLMTRYADVMGTEGQGIVARIDGALEFVDQLIQRDPLFARGMPNLTDRISKIRAQNRHYVAHEYFNRDWHPMHFATMSDWLNPAKLTFASSAYYFDHVDSLCVSADQRDLLAQISDESFRQTVRDFIVNQQFRRDYWIRGGRKLPPLQKVEALRRQRVLLITHRADVPKKVTGATIEAELSEAVYKPILDYLADHRPRTLGEIEAAVRGEGIAFAQVLQAILILAGGRNVALVQDEAITAEARRRTDRLNAHLIDKARGDSDVSYLASPVSGGGIAVDRFQQLFLFALNQGRQKPAEWADLVWQILSAQGAKLVKEGKVIETAEDNLAELCRQARIFSEKELPILKALQVI